MFESMQGIEEDKGATGCREWMLVGQAIDRKCPGESIEPANQRIRQGKGQ